MGWLSSLVPWGVVYLAVSPAWAGVYETLILKDGQRVTGEVVAEKQNALYVDLGYDLLRIPRDQIVHRTKGDDSSRVPVQVTGIEDDSSGLFSSGVLKPSPVKELV